MVTMKYFAVYKLNIIPLEEDYDLIDDDEIHAVITAGPIQFSYSVPIIINKPPSTMMTFGKKDINLPKDKYLTILVYIDGQSFDIEVKRASLKVAEIASLFDLQYPNIIAEKIYEGTISEANVMSFAPQGPLRITAQPIIDPLEITAKIAEHINILKQLNQNDRERYQLASRWLRKGFETLNQIDKLIAWWTVLEIYPATGSSDIPRHVCDFLVNSLYNHLTPSELKTKLKIGRMFGLRSRIIHDGKAYVEDDERDEFSDYLERLQAIATVCLRILAGLDPGNELEKYLN